MQFAKILFDDHYNKLDILGKDRHKVEHAFVQLQDENSRRLFFKYLESHLPLGFSHMDEPLDISLQYLAHDIPETKDYSRFVDCGGYDGDTFRQLTAHGCHIRSLAVFRTTNRHVPQICSNCERASSGTGTSISFPAASMPKTTQLRFATNVDAQSSAKVSANGDSTIQCVSLDEALPGFAPTFIKMDIEGAETAAIKGAQGLIETYGPSLAICVYHGLSDLWEVPWLISSMRSDYRYYLRNYNYSGLETVFVRFPQPYA
ncbi:MAG: FkbM family methyltransferase [Candidatus Competibacteraceae bacterium]|nr:FkbM family methyltransferase [Candidatus Competibacteraceae bacterium]